MLLCISFFKIELAIYNNGLSRKKRNEMVPIILWLGGRCAKAARIQNAPEGPKSWIEK